MTDVECSEADLTADEGAAESDSAMSSPYLNFWNFPRRRRSEEQRFGINFKTLALITKISMGINIAIFMYFSFMHLPQVPMYAPSEIRLFDNSAKLFIPGAEHRHVKPARNAGRMNLTKPTTSKCIKHMAVFGFRDFWYTFCRYERFSYYKYLVEFPRELYCPEVNCYLTMNVTKEPRDLHGKDIVLFTDVDDWLSKDQWKWAIGNRTEGQRWVMVTEESPLYAPGIRPPANYGKTTFDWFGSYKSDSDFVQPYGYYAPYGNGQRPATSSFDRYKVLAIKKKLPLVLWMGSHCETLQWNRVKFVSDFEKLVSIKKYGKCLQGEFLQWNNETLIEEILSRYKFYLSLENSCCKDYVTEKFWRSMQYNIVPIVVGPPLEDYKKIAPPNSFIHPDQFDSMIDMATHILELGADDDKYMKYFEWKKKGSVFVYSQEEYYIHPLKNESNCDILKKYIESSKPSGTSSQMLDYFGPKWEGSCGPCSRKSWLKDTYMHPPDYKHNGKLWD